jgi:hypothetical protein
MKKKKKNCIKIQEFQNPLKKKRKRKNFNLLVEVHQVPLQAHHLHHLIIERKKNKNKVRIKVRIIFKKMKKINQRLNKIYK